MFPSYYCSQVMTDALMLEYRQKIERAIERQQWSQVPDIHRPLLGQRLRQLLWGPRARATRHVLADTTIDASP